MGVAALIASINRTHARRHRRARNWANSGYLIMLDLLLRMRLACAAAKS